MRRRGALCAAALLASGILLTGCERVDGERPESALEFPLPDRPVSGLGSNQFSTETQRDSRGEAATAAAPSSQALAGSLQSWRSCAIMHSYTGACGRAGKRAGKMGGDEKEIASACSSSSAAWSGGFCRRSKLCNGSVARATLPAFPLSACPKREGAIQI